MVFNDTNEGIISYVPVLVVEFKPDAEETKYERQSYEVLTFICGREWSVFDFWTGGSRFGTFKSRECLPKTLQKFV